MLQMSTNAYPEHRVVQYQKTALTTLGVIVVNARMASQMHLEIAKVHVGK